MKLKKRKRSTCPKTRPRKATHPPKRQPIKASHLSSELELCRSRRGDQRLVAHLVIVTALVVLVVILVLLHVVGGLVADFFPVDVLAAGAAAAGDDVLFGDGLEVVIGFLVV